MNISATCYSPSEYSEEEVSFASNEGIGEVDLAIVCDTTSSMSELHAPIIKRLVKQPALIDLFYRQRNKESASSNGGIS